MWAVLPQLHSNTAIREGILSASLPDNEKCATVNALKRLFQGEARSLQDFIENYTRNRRDGQTDVRQEHDAQEFLSSLQEIVDGCLADHGMEKLIEKETVFNLNSHLIARDEEKLYFRARASPCLEITVDIFGKGNLHQSLEDLVKGETVEYSWPGGEKPLPSRRRSSLKTLPHMLVIQLKRFELDYETMTVFKLEHRLEFPLELDMFPYTSTYLLQKDGISQETQRDDSQSQMTPSECRYHLKGVVAHDGPIDGGGVYYSFIKERPSAEKRPEDCRWWKFSDFHRKQPWDISMLEQDCFGGQNNYGRPQVGNTAELRRRNNSAYLLFYEQAPEGTGE